MRHVVTQAQGFELEASGGRPEADPGRPWGPWMVFGCGGLTPPWTLRGPVRRPVMGGKPPAWAETDRWRVPHLGCRKVAKSLPTWTLADSGGTFILPLNHISAFSKRTHMMAPVESVKHRFSTEIRGFGSRGPRNLRGVFTKRTHMIRAVRIAKGHGLT